MSDQNTELLQSIDSRLKSLELLTREIRTLVGPFSTVFPNGDMLVQTIFGNKYFIDPSDEIMAPQLVVYRQWESDLSTYITNSVNNDTYFVDVGSNFGYFTCLAGSRIGQSGHGKVLSVEANPKMQRLLRKNTKINWSMAPIVIAECAVASKPGFIKFSVPSDRAANGSIATESSNASDTFLVECKALDELTEERAVDIMKIDVEGFEANVLMGAVETIGRSPDINIVIEWSVNQMADAGHSIDEVLDLIENLGLSTYRLPRSKNISESDWATLLLEKETLHAIGYDNIVLRRAK